MPMKKPGKKQRACEYNHVLFSSTATERFRAWGADQLSHMNIETAVKTWSLLQHHLYLLSCLFQLVL
jgi:hypothetical protein